MVQAILIFGSEMWVVTPPIGKNLGGGSPPGLKADHGKETSVAIQWNLSVPRACGGDIGGEVGGTINVNLQNSEHSGPVYSN